MLNYHIPLSGKTYPIVPVPFKYQKHINRLTSWAGMCQSECDEMIEQFPELRKVRGVVRTKYGEYGHFWCVDPCGNAVDPTLKQYTDPLGCYRYKLSDLLEYEEMDESQKDLLPVGKCHNCGELTYYTSNTSFCDDRCETNYREYLMKC